VGAIFRILDLLDVPGQKVSLIWRPPSRPSKLLRMPSAFCTGRGVIESLLRPYTTSRRDVAVEICDGFTAGTRTGDDVARSKRSQVWRLMLAEPLSGS